VQPCEDEEHARLAGAEQTVCLPSETRIHLTRLSCVAAEDIRLSAVDMKPTIEQSHRSGLLLVVRVERDRST
jgi:hypothetical protein